MIKVRELLVNTFSEALKTTGYGRIIDIVAHAHTHASYQRSVWLSDRIDWAQVKL